jgi:hypothetical protein
MAPTRAEIVFPQETLFFRMDGVLFALLPENRWCALDDGGYLIPLNDAYAAEISRMTDHGEIITESAFRMGLAEDAAMPEFESA